MNALTRFLKIMLFTAVLAVLGPVLIFVVIMSMSPGSHLRSDINYEEHVRPLVGAIGMWFGMMFLVGMVSFVAGLPRKFNVGMGDRDSFVGRMDAAARVVRYRPQGRVGNQLTYKPPFYAFLAEKIRVEMGEGAAIVSAPHGLRRKLEKSLAAGA